MPTHMQSLKEIYRFEYGFSSTKKHTVYESCYSANTDKKHDMVVSNYWRILYSIIKSDPRLIGGFQANGRK
uniref:Uncharacterized protein n=1 Tax=Acrobeloides nanus TaxID=290746 RepID=A0A914C260_9BILA